MNPLATEGSVRVPTVGRQAITEFWVYLNTPVNDPLIAWVLIGAVAGIAAALYYLAQQNVRRERQ